MIINKSIPLKDFFYDRLKFYRIWLPVILSIAFGTLFSLLIIFLRSNSDLNLAKAISRHLVTLIDTQDRTETLRLLGSIAKERDVEITVTNGNKVFASSIFSTINSNINFEDVYLNTDKFFVTKNYLVSFNKLYRDGSNESVGNIYVYSSLSFLMRSAIAIFLFVLFFGLVSGRLYTQSISNEIGHALLPIHDLHDEIKNLLDDKRDIINKSYGITELDKIIETVISTKRSLYDATDRIAGLKAKELVTENYQRLIHDIYTPVAALQTALNIRDENKNDSFILEKTNLQVKRLAEQILSQISSIKENLGHEPKVFVNVDIHECVKEALSESLLAKGNQKTIEVLQKIEGHNIQVPHDPVLLKRAVSNLINNALSSCRSLIQIEIEKLSTNQVSIKVSDDGPGMNPDEISLHLQGRLTSRNGSRPSFGLPSANHIVRMHGGRIIYQKSQYGGACFEVRI